MWIRRDKNKGGWRKRGRMILMQSVGRWKGKRGKKIGEVVGRWKGKRTEKGWRSVNIKKNKC